MNAALDDDEPILVAELDRRLLEPEDEPLAERTLQWKLGVEQALDDRLVDPDQEAVGRNERSFFLVLDHLAETLVLALENRLARQEFGLLLGRRAAREENEEQQNRDQ